MKILYFDCPMGISGDMCLGALIDLGVDAGRILKEIRRLPIERFDVKIGKEVRHSISGTTFRVSHEKTHEHRSFKDIKRILTRGGLSSDVLDLSLSIFSAIAVAEGKVHGIKTEDVEFHEVGAIDSIVDIVGAALALKSLGIDRVYSAPIPLGAGWVTTMHGRLPIPAPATLEILRGAPIAPSTAPFELTTPTGAAIVKTVAHGFSGMPSMVVEKIGYGAGKKDFKESANVLRLIVGSAEEAPADGKKVVVMETNIDDMSAQVAGYLMERLYEKGALDVFFTPVQMKKNRPGMLLTVIADTKDRDLILDAVFSESTSIGVRAYPVERYCLERIAKKVRTPYGEVRVKISVRGNAVVNSQPEYEDCRAIAKEKGVPLKKVIDAARSAAEKGIARA